MALIFCRECGKPISEEAVSCPNCGCPVQDTSLRSNDFSEKREENQAKPVQRKRKYGCLVWIAILLILLLTCPGKDSHAEKINEAFTEYMGSRSIDNNGEALSYGLALLLGNYAINRITSVDNYGVFSLGRISFGGESRIVSFGILGHVFTFSLSTLKEDAPPEKEIETDSMNIKP